VTEYAGPSIRGSVTKVTAHLADSSSVELLLGALNTHLDRAHSRTQPAAQDEGTTTVQWIVSAMCNSRIMLSHIAAAARRRPTHSADIWHCAASLRLTRCHLLFSITCVWACCKKPLQCLSLSSSHALRPTFMLTLSLPPAASQTTTVPLLAAHSSLSLADTAPLSCCLETPNCWQAP
jgi:hypothetical protein